ncbi:A-kinase anchor protein 17B-like isoform 2-T5 [Discoglossus pictus]
MTVITVYDNSEAVELSTLHHLYLKPKAKLIITVILPQGLDPCRSISNWEILEQLKNLVHPDHFSSIKVSKSTREYIRIEGEVDTKYLTQIFLAKLYGQILQTNSFNEPLLVEVTEAPHEFPVKQESPCLLTKNESDPESLGKNDSPPSCIYLEGLPCKWFLSFGSNSEKPSEDVLRSVFEKYGKITNVDIPMLDPYREDSVGKLNSMNSGGLQTFDAFLHYADNTNSANAMQSLQGMKLMFTGEDGKSLACDIKVSMDTTDHFSEEAVNKRNAESLKLQELEQQRKQEKEEEEAERKRKMEERKSRAKKRRAKLKRKAQKLKELEASQKAEQEPFIEDGEEDSQEWEERKLLLAQRRVEAIKLLTLLLDKLNDVVKEKRMKEELVDCNFVKDFNECSLSTLSGNETPISLPVIDENETSQAECTDESENKPYSPGDQLLLDKIYKPKKRVRKVSVSEKANFKNDFVDDAAQTEVKDELENMQVEDFDDNLSHSKEFVNESCNFLRRSHSKEFVNESCNFLRRSHSKEFVNESCNFLKRSHPKEFVNESCNILKRSHPKEFVNESCNILKMSHSQDFENERYCKKLKIYETDEFINYLLNYYHYPEYARFCIETENNVSKSWCQRMVYCNGNSFQIKLKNLDYCYTEMKLDQGPNHAPGKWKITVQKPQEDYLRRVPKGSQKHLETTKQNVSLAKTRSYFKKGNEHVHQRQWDNDGDDPQISESDNELKDVLEEISSTSEYFSEEESEVAAKHSNIRKKPKKQARAVHCRKGKQYKLFDKNMVCHHDDILGHFLDSYSACSCFKKHLKCSHTETSRKTSLKLHCDTQTSKTESSDTESRTSESDISESDTSEDQRINRKRLKKKIPPVCLANDKKYYKGKSVTTVPLVRESSSSDSHQLRTMRRKRQSKKSKTVHKTECHDAKYLRKARREPKELECYYPDDESESFEHDTHSLTWSSSSLGRQTGSSVTETDHPGSSKGSFDDYLDWERHFYSGNGVLKGRKYKS